MRAVTRRTFVQWSREMTARYGYVFAVVCIVVATALFIPGRAHFAKGQWALFYLLIIGLIASLSGVRAAIVAAVVAFFAWNYFFLPPYHTFYIRDPKDWISLFAFLAVGVAVGVQTGRMREREAEAISREREMALLNKFSAHLVSDIAIPEMADALLLELSRIAEAECAILFLPDDSGKLQAVHPSAGVCRPDPTALDFAKWSYREAKAVGLPVGQASPETASAWPISVTHEYTGLAWQGRSVCVPLLSTTGQEGVLYVGPRADKTDYAVYDARLFVAAANLVAAFLERKRLQAVAVQADALNEADRLKSTLVSSVSHELKTPLAAMTATVSNLLEGDVEWDASDLRRELESLQANLNRLNTSIDSLVDLSRLEAAAWEPKKDWCEIGDIVSAALAKLSSRDKARVSYEVPEDLPSIQVDFQQWARVIGNLLENALAYGGSEEPVKLTASAAERETRISIEDHGPGVPPDERERVFEKFFRGAASARVPSGTGLGLAITREIVRFHGGRIWVEDVTPHGAKFVVSLPREEGK